MPIHDVGVCRKTCAARCPLCCLSSSFLSFLVFATSGNTGLVGIYGTLAFLLSWIDQDWFGIVAGRTIRRKLHGTSGERRSQTRKIIWVLAKTLDVNNRQDTTRRSQHHTSTSPKKNNHGLCFFLLCLFIWGSFLGREQGDDLWAFLFFPGVGNIQGSLESEPQHTTQTEQDGQRGGAKRGKTRKKSGKPVQPALANLLAAFSDTTQARSAATHSICRKNTQRSGCSWLELGDTQRPRKKKEQ